VGNRLKIYKAPSKNLSIQQAVFHYFQSCPLAADNNPKAIPFAMYWEQQRLE